MSIEGEARFKLNKRDMMAATYRAFHDLNLILGRRMQQKLTARIWPWPNITRTRGKGKRGKVRIEGSPRDIVDTGALRDSYDMYPVASGHMRHVYDIEYAMAVHNGAVIRNAWGKGILVVLPARPWIRVALRESNLGSDFQKLFNLEISKIQATQLEGDSP